MPVPGRFPHAGKVRRKFREGFRTRGKSAGSSGKVSARGDSLPEVPGRFPHSGKVRRKFREGFRTRGKSPGNSGKVSALGESLPEVPARADL
jgi:hypothetical protein